MIEFNESVIDTAKIRFLKGSRGVAIFTEQEVGYSNSDDQLLFANKVLTNEEAIQLRDYLNENYPLEELV